VRDHILTQARNRFRVKESNTVYRQGGAVIYDGDTLLEQLEEVLMSGGGLYWTTSKAQQNRWERRGGECAREPEFGA